MDPAGDAALRPLAVRVQDVSIEYELVGGDEPRSLRERLVSRRRVERKVLRAVQHVTFDAREGDAIGVVGSNGSGKSTLLAGIAGLLPLASGSILASEEPKLLGVGATLLPDVSGMRNIMLGCLALGMAKDEIEHRAPEIAEFTGLGDAIHRPLRTYSSGMKARLHFSIATAVEPRILLIDEALAVGDKNFRAKSQARIEELLGSAGVLILVSHSLGEIRRLCNRALWVEKGVLRMDGGVDEVLEAYEAEE